MIALERSHYDDIVAHCQGEYPNEACGLVAGKDGVAVRVIPMRNADASPATYRFDAKEQFRVFGEMDDVGLDVYGIFHSHTHSEAFPSATDRDRAHMRDPESGDLVPWFPDSAYLILSLATSPPVLRGFRFEGAEIAEEEVTIQ